MIVKQVLKRIIVNDKSHSSNQLYGANRSFIRPATCFSSLSVLSLASFPDTDCGVKALKLHCSNNSQSCQLPAVLTVAEHFNIPLRSS